MYGLEGMPNVRYVNPDRPMLLSPNPPKPPNVKLRKDGSVLCEFHDENGDYIVHAGTVLLSLGTAVEAQSFGWHGLPQTDEEAQLGLVKVHRTFGEAAEQYVKAYGLPHGFESK